MNILTENLPDVIAVGRTKYAVQTDFRIWIEFDRVLHLTKASVKDKIMMIFKLCFDCERCKTLPDDITRAMDALCSFYLCGKTKEHSSVRMEKKERALDFSEDGGYIYSAFLTQYGIDLLSIPYLHWYAFSALLEGLEEERLIKRIIGFRICRPEDVENKEKRKYLKRMKEIYALPDTRTCKEKEEELAEVLSQIF